jgi:hypothetical protein
MSTISDPITHPLPTWARERPAPTGGELPRGPAPSHDEPPTGRRPIPFLVTLLRALSAWHA